MMPIPISPPTIPTNEDIFGRSLSSVRNKAVQIGIAATIRDATPIGTTFSAKAIVPNPVPSISTPKKIELDSSLRVKRNESQPFRTPMKTKSAKLAATNLNDIDINGGIVSIVKAIPMYVVPQATYMIPKPIATLVLIELFTGTHYCGVRIKNVLGGVR